MTVFLTLDDSLHRTFLNKRVSRDEAVVQDVLSAVGDAPLLVSDYSAALFDPARIQTASDPLAAANEGDFVFSEREALAPHAARIRTLVFYRWNRRYPGDFSLDIDPKALGFTLTSSITLNGKSHPEITREEYRR